MYGSKIRLTILSLSLILILTACADNKSGAVSKNDSAAISFNSLIPDDCTLEMVEKKSVYTCTNFGYTFDESGNLVVISTSSNGNSNSPSKTSELKLPDGTVIPSVTIPKDWDYDFEYAASVDYAQVDAQGKKCAKASAKFSGIFRADGSNNLLRNDTNFLGDQLNSVSGSDDLFTVNSTVEIGKFNSSICPIYLIETAYGAARNVIITNPYTNEEMEYSPSWGKAIMNDIDFWMNKNYYDVSKL